MSRPLFLVLEGLDGTGKSTQCRLLAEWLRGLGRAVVACAEPGGTALGDVLRDLLLHQAQPRTALAEALLFMASRAQLVAEVIRPALVAGTMVISDRFLLSTVVYQGHAGGLDPDMLWTIGRVATSGLEPDCTLVLDLPERRAEVRRGATGLPIESSRAQRIFMPAFAPAFYARRSVPPTASGSSTPRLRSTRCRAASGPRFKRSWMPASDGGLNLSWSRIIGHMAARDAFNRAWQRGRLAHAYLFVGPAGIGKRLFAEELAKALLCEHHPENRLEACDRCAACQLVVGGTHPDLFTAGRVQDKANIGIDVVRELCRKLSLKPVRGSRKIALLDDADELNDPVSQQAAPNAFLKTLEEPPPGSILILVGTSADQQLPTVLSRCQIMRFDPLTEQQVVDCLRAADVTDASLLKRAARLSDGSPGQALALAEPSFWQFRCKLIDALARRPFGCVGLGRAWMEFVEEAGKDAASQRRRAGIALRFLIDVMTDALAVAQQGQARRTVAEDRAAVETLARFGPEALLELLDRCLQADRQNDRRVQLVLVVEALLDAMAQRLRSA